VSRSLAAMVAENPLGGRKVPGHFTRLRAGCVAGEKAGHVCPPDTAVSSVAKCFDL